MFIVNASQITIYESAEDFEENAKIDGKFLKDIWYEVENTNWLQ